MAETILQPIVGVFVTTLVAMGEAEAEGSWRTRRPRNGGRGKEEKEWIPVTKLGRLVKDGTIKSLKEIQLFSLPIKVRICIDMIM